MDNARTEGRCLNCDTELLGAHCHACGQRGEVHRTLGAFFHDLLHGVLHFEGKIWRTLPLLAWRPGRLTREYIDGRRAAYVSPIALFLFVVLLTYLVGTALTPADAFDGIEIGGDIEEGYRDAEDGVSEAEAALALARDSDASPARIAILEEQLEGARSERDAIAGTIEAMGFGSAEGRATETNLMKADPKLIAYKLQTNAYKFAWLLIPLSAPFVWLLFPFSRAFRMYDHAVFVTYSIAFMLTLAGAAILIGLAGLDWLAALLICYAPFHLYRHIRGTYGTTRFGALWRMLLASAFIWVVFAIFAVALGYASGLPTL